MPIRRRSIERLLQRQAIAFLVAATLASVLLILAGLLLDGSNKLLAALLVAVGGSALGTCFGITFGSVSDASTLHRIKELLETAFDTTFSGSEKDLDTYRRVWHHYLVTKIDDKFVWRYRQVDFSRIAISGKLIASLVVPDANGQIHVYGIEAFLIGARLLFVQTPSGGSEPAVIHIYPQAGELFRSTFAGLAVLQSWDGDHLNVPALMCRDPITFSGQNPPEGTLPDATYDQLDKLWLREAKRAGLLPTPRSGMQISSTSLGSVP